MAEGHLGFLIFYVGIFAAVSLFGFYGAGEIGMGGEFAEPPSLSGENLTLLNSLLFVFELVIFFFFLQGLTIFGLPQHFTVLLSLILNIGLLYVIARLVRGGG